MLNFIKNRANFFISALFSLLLGGLVLLAALLLSNDYSLMGWFDATFFASLILVFVAWLIFVSGQGFFDMMIYGVKSFGLGFVGKKPNETYTDYRLRHEKTDRNIYYGIFFVLSLFLISSLVLYFMYKSSLS